MLKKALIATCAASIVTGCASTSEDIAATYVSPIKYESFSCRQIGEEATRISARASHAMGVQDQQASDDAGVTALSLILFWPAVFFIDGDDTNAVEVARLKGEMDALEQASIQKNCDIRFR